MPCGGAPQEFLTLGRAENEKAPAPPWRAGPIRNGDSFLGCLFSLFQIFRIPSSRRSHCWLGRWSLRTLPALRLLVSVALVLTTEAAFVQHVALWGVAAASARRESAGLFMHSFVFHLFSFVESASELTDLISITEHGQRMMRASGRYFHIPAAASSSGQVRGSLKKTALWRNPMCTSWS